MPSNLPDRNLTRPVTPSGATLGTAMENLRHRWGWFIALGALALVLGTLALVMEIHATITTVYIVAIFIIIAGGAEITVGMNSKTWARAFLWGIAGLCYIVAGAFFLARPSFGAVILTLMLGSAMLAAGAVRVYIGTHMHSHAKTMVILGGLVTALVGLLIIFGWPANSLIILGTLLGIDLIFTGMMWIGFGLRLRNHA